MENAKRSLGTSKIASSSHSVHSDVEELSTKAGWERVKRG